MSRRFGGDKLSAALPNGDRVVVAAARSLIEALPRVVAVVRSPAGEAAKLLEPLGVSLVVPERSRSGMGSSLSAGVAETATATGWVIALGDMPYIRENTIRSVSAHVTCPTDIAFPFFGGRSGHPVAFGSAYRDDLMQLNGDVGARGILQRFSHCLRPVACQDEGIFRDIDWPAELL